MSFSTDLSFLVPQRVITAATLMPIVAAVNSRVRTAGARPFFSLPIRDPKRRRWLFFSETCEQEIWQPMDQTADHFVADVTHDILNDQGQNGFAPLPSDYCSMSPQMQLRAK